MFWKILLMSGLLFSKGRFLESIFGSELLFFLSSCGLLFFSGILPMFFLYCLSFRSRTCFGKILLMSGLLFSKGRFLESIFGSELLFFLSSCGLLFFSGILPMFFLYCFVFSLQDMFWKILLMSGFLFFYGSLFGIHFRERTFVFPVLLWFVVF